jgi:hypothetical protein
MGRSVDYLNHASYVAYISMEPVMSLVEDEEGKEIEVETTDYYILKELWDDFEDYIIEIIQDICPSLDKSKRCEGGEVNIILENNHAEIGLSEYCGLVSVSIRVSEMYFVNENLARHWINQVWPKINKKINEAFGKNSLKKIGSFSNGEGIFESA